MKVRQVTKMELTSWRIALKLGRDSARNRRTATTRERNTILFRLKAKIGNSRNVTVFTLNLLAGIPSSSSMNWFGGFMNIGWADTK